jgi:hypothetical protein
MQPSAAKGMGSARRALEARGAESSPTGSASRGWGRAFGLGPSRAAVAILCAVVLAGAGALVLVTRGPHGGSIAAGRHTAAPGALKYGGLPSWLPKAKVKVGQVLHASAAHPALSIEGEAVSVELAGARVLATAVGPEVPEEGRFPVSPVTPCTFIVTFASASRAIPLSAASFFFTDEQGKLHHPSVSALGGGAPPTRITPGRSVSVMLHDILPTGEGALSWAPHGPRAIATWDYTVEID